MGQAKAGETLEKAPAVDEVSGEDAEPDKKPANRLALESGQERQKQIELNGRNPEETSGRPERGGEGAAHEKHQPSGRQEVGQTAAVGREAADKKAPVESVTTHLSQMGEEERATVVKYQRAGLIEETSLLAVDEIEAEQRILAGPEVGAKAPRRSERLRPDQEVATGKIIGFADTAGEISETGAPRNDPSAVNGAAQLSQEGIVRGGDGRTANADDAGKGEVRKGAFQPVWGWVGIIIEKGNDLPLGFPNAHISFFGRTEAAGGNFPNGIWPGVAGGMVGEEKDLLRRNGLTGKGADGLVKVLGLGGTGDKDGDGRKGMRKMHIGDGVIITEQVKAVEDGEGIVEHGAHRLP